MHFNDNIDKCTTPSPTTAWPSGLRRGTQVAVERSAWVRTPPLSFSGLLATKRKFQNCVGLLFITKQLEIMPAATLH